jgi:hypothetical protein
VAASSKTNETNLVEPFFVLRISCLLNIVVRNMKCLLIWSWTHCTVSWPFFATLSLFSFISCGHAACFIFFWNSLSYVRQHYLEWRRLAELFLFLAYRSCSIIFWTIFQFYLTILNWSILKTYRDHSDHVL